jgi:tripartite-type tricarboxylate transporter receptor subunit TctC
MRFIFARHRLAIALLGLAAAVVAGSAWAQKPPAWPTKLIRIVVPYSAGIGVDIAARIIAPKLSERLGQPVIVENKAGASGIIGTEFVAKSAPDGHTLGMAVNTLVITASTRTVAFDPVKDFAPVIKIGEGAFLLTAHSSLEAKNVRDLVALAKARPGKINYGTPGAGTPGHLAFELLKQLAGIDLFHVPYKGMPPSVLGHASGDVAVMITPVEMARQHLDSGRIRALAATGGRRNPEFPDLPTVAESGLPGFSLELWYGLLAPAGTPAAIVERLNAELVQILGQADVKDAMRKQSIETTPGAPQVLETLIREELARWKKVAADARIRLDN